MPNQNKISVEKLSTTQRIIKFNYDLLCKEKEGKLGLSAQNDINQEAIQRREDVHEQRRDGSNPKGAAEGISIVVHA